MAKPSLLAIASTVVESSPPLSRTTAVGALSGVDLDCVVTGSLPSKLHARRYQSAASSNTGRNGFPARAVARQLPSGAVGPTFSARRGQIVLGSERQSTQTRSGCENLEDRFARGDRADDCLRDRDTGWTGKRRHQPAITAQDLST